MAWAMTLRNRILPFLIPVALISISFWRSGVVQKYFEAQALQRRSVAAQSKLDQLRAVDVASNLNDREYKEMVKDFADLAGLSLDPETAPTKGEVSAKVGRLIDAVVADMDRFGSVQPEEPYLVFKGVQPGVSEAIPPFLVVNFEMNLEGKYLAMPLFLDSLSRIAREQKCPISVGGIRVSPVEPGSNSGVLDITIPLRAYFVER